MAEEGEERSLSEAEVNRILVSRPRMLYVYQLGIAVMNASEIPYVVTEKSVRCLDAAGDFLLENTPDLIPRGFDTRGLDGVDSEVNFMEVGREREVYLSGEWMFPFDEGLESLDTEPLAHLGLRFGDRDIRLSLAASDQIPRLGVAEFSGHIFEGASQNVGLLLKDLETTIRSLYSHS